jgi:sugar phosphate permease
LRLGGAAGFSLCMLLVYAFFATFADMLYVNWIPSFLVEGKRLSEETMGWFAPLPLLGGALGGVAGGVLNDVLLRRSRGPRWARSGVALAGKLMAAVLILASLAVADGRWVMVLLLGCKFFADWGLSTQWGAMTDMGGRGTGTLFGVVNTAGSLGGFAAGPLMGHLKQHHGWEGLFLGVAAAYVTAALAWLFIDCTRRLVDDTPAR